MAWAAVATTEPPPPEALGGVPAHPSREHSDGFYSLSAELTGFSEVELLQTGVGRRYVAWLARVFPDVLADLLAVWRSVESEYPPENRADGVWSAILADPRLGPFARGVLALWYTATWTSMPAGWSAAFGDHHDASCVFALAYPEALMWRVSPGIHPEGAKPTGFASWAARPAGA